MIKQEIKEKINELIKEHFSKKDPQDQDESSKVGVGFPCYGHEEIISAVDSLLDLRLTQGKKVAEFEKYFSNYIGKKQGVAVNSGSSANLLAIYSLIETGKIRPGSEVIVPAATFTTVISPIIQNGLTPVFVDIDPKTHNINPEEIEKAITEKTGLIMPVHSLGCPADMEEIMRIANDHKIPVLEDCCEAHGAAINEKKAGSYGIISTYSFFVAHNITSGEGGLILTDDDELTKFLRSAREFGRMVPPQNPGDYSYNDGHLQDYDDRYVFLIKGYNMRMTDIHAALGLEQAKKLDALNLERRKIVEELNKGLKKFSEHLQLPHEPEGYYHSYYTYPIVVKENAPFTRQEIAKFLEKNNIETRAFMGGNLALHPAYRKDNLKIVGNLKNTENLMNNAFFIGCHPNITQNQISRVINAFEEFFKQKTEN